MKLQKEVEDKKIHFFGVGVSGGEVGARYGPSIMPGGSDKEIYNDFLKKPCKKEKKISTCQQTSGSCFADTVKISY